MSFNKKELIILSHLRQNARKSLTEIFRQTGVPVSTLFDKLKKYEKGLIKKNTVLLNFNKLGFGVRVKILLKAAKDQKENLRIHLVNSHNVNSVSSVTNGFDFLIEALFRNLKDMQQFSDNIEQFNLTKKEEFFIIEEFKSESFLSQPEFIELV